MGQGSHPPKAKIIHLKVTQFMTAFGVHTSIGEYLFQFEFDF